MKLPAGSALEDLLELRGASQIHNFLDDSLLGPLKEFFARPGKEIRGKMVEIGYSLAGDCSSTGTETGMSTSVHANNAPCDPRLAETTQAQRTEAQCKGCAMALEALHAGSLVVDDIEDESHERRGGPALHRTHGIPIALNAGNWLYFWPLQIIRGLGLSSDKEVRIYQLFNKTLLRAHFGQALDVGSKIDRLRQDQVAAVCRAALELKTGALMALALGVGAVLAGANEERLQLLMTFGHQFGVGLQMFDDLGKNVYTDLALKRPTWIWAYAAENFDALQYQKFVDGVALLPDRTELTNWFESVNFFSHAHDSASSHVEDAFDVISIALEADAATTAKALQALRELQRTIQESYAPSS